MSFAGRIARLSVSAKVIIVLAVMLIFCSLYQCGYCPSWTKEGFETVTVKKAREGFEGNAKKPEFILFYVEWCPHCKTVLPEFNQLKSQTVEIKSLNAEDPTNAELVKLYNVEAYPTIIMVKDGKVIEYNEDRSKESLERFMNSHA